MGISPAQVWYIATVYPEAVSVAEVQKSYEKKVARSDANRSYWEVAAKRLNEIALGQGSGPTVEHVFSDTDAEALLGSAGAATPYGRVH